MPDQLVIVRLRADCEVASNDVMERSVACSCSHKGQEHIRVSQPFAPGGVAANGRQRCAFYGDLAIESDGLNVVVLYGTEQYRDRWSQLGVASVEFATFSRPAKRINHHGQPLWVGRKLLACLYQRLMAVPIALWFSWSRTNGY
jgi:hypothetical protein